MSKIDERSSGDRCWTCGRPRGLAQRRKSWGVYPTPSIPRTDNTEDSPAQIHNDLICSVSVYRNGGTNEHTHLCDECLRIALREIKCIIAKKLDELDAGHDKDAELAEVNQRLSSLQYRHYMVCFDHDRMQDRLRDLLGYVQDGADQGVIEMAQFEVNRKKARE